jgi:hypothetical protein
MSPGSWWASLVASSAGSPVRAVVLGQAGLSRGVEVTTYLGRARRRSAQPPGVRRVGLLGLDGGPLGPVGVGDRAEPAAAAQAVGVLAGRVLDDAVQGDVLADDDLAHGRSPSGWAVESG